jgi:hypothetical protein
MEDWMPKFVETLSMNHLPQPEAIIQYFLTQEITPATIQSQQLVSDLGIRLIECHKSRFDERNAIAQKKSVSWTLDQEELAWGSYLTLNGLVRRWDITTDASMVCFRKSFVEYVFYTVSLLSQQEIDAIAEAKRKATAEKEQKEKIRDLLTPVLIQKMYPFSKLETGELERDYGVRLKQFNRDAHRFMRYKPGDQNDWVVGKSLNWGSNTGWDITQDGKIACCRVNYDDYVNFDIEILSAEERAAYQQSAANKKCISRLATLQEMFNQSLITAAEYANKKQAVLDSL